MNRPGRRRASPPGRALGVDLGSRRIGLALSDPSGTVATPHSVLERDRRRARDHAAIVRTARDEGATRIVVGLPRSLSGRIGPAARGVLDEVEELQAVAGETLPVEVYDERFTTVVAERALVDAGVRRDRRRAVVDQVAAAVMLQGWLESRS